MWSKRSKLTGPEIKPNKAEQNAGSKSKDLMHNWLLNVNVDNRFPHKNYLL